MAELGETSDPKALVPGSPQVLWDHADLLRGHGELLGNAGDGLKQVNVGSWQGDAADAFHDVFVAQPPKWLRAGDFVSSAADVLGGYGDTLNWAQGRAADAVALWDQGKDATRQALAAGIDRALDSVTAGVSTPVLADPGEAYRQQARDLLTRARQQVGEAGDTAAELLRTHTTSASGEIGPHAGDSGSITVGGDTLSGSADVLLGAKGSASASAGLAGVSAQASGFIGAEAEASGQISGGPAVLSGNAEVLSGAQGDASASAGLLGVGVEASGFIGEKASAGVTAGLGPGEVSLDGDASSGAEAGVDGAFGLFDGVGANAFIGQKAEVGENAEVAGAGAGATASVSDGIGAEVGGHAGYHDGAFTVSGDIGATLGIGADISGQITIDPGKMWDSADQYGGDVVSGMADGADDVANGLSGAAHKAHSVVKKLTGWL